MPNLHSQSPSRWAPHQVTVSAAPDSTNACRRRAWKRRRMDTYLQRQNSAGRGKIANSEQSPLINPSATAARCQGRVWSERLVSRAQVAVQRRLRNAGLGGDLTEAVALAFAERVLDLVGGWATGRPTRQPAASATARAARSAVKVRSISASRGRHWPRHAARAGPPPGRPAPATRPRLGETAVPR